MSCLIATKLSMVVRVVVRNVYLPNRPNRSGYRQEKDGKFEFWLFNTEKRQLFWTVFWPCMVTRWCPMQFGDARWSLGGPHGPWVLPGCSLVVIGHKMNVLES